MKFEKVNPATGAAAPGFSRGTDASKEQVNHYTGKLNDGALINKGRGPTVGNKGTLAGGKVPPVSSLPSTTKTKSPDYINGGAQYRGVGGTSVPKVSADARINKGRGPTKGNQ